MLDLDAIREKRLNTCGACDVGMPEYGCSHPTEDYRPVMLSLIAEVERLRRLWGMHIVHAKAVEEAMGK